MPAPIQRRKRPFLRLLKWLFLLLFVIFIVIFLFPAPVLRIIFSCVETQTGISITFEKAHLYLVKGPTLLINGLTIKRQNHHDNNFDIKADQLEILIDSFIPSTVHISGLLGTYARIGKSTTSTKAYVSVLTVEDAQIDFIDRTLEKPFQTTIQIEKFDATAIPNTSLFEPYICSALGQISSAKFIVQHNNSFEAGNIKQNVWLIDVPLGLFASYAPILDDIFVSGSMNIQIDDISDATQKKLRVAVILLPDCQIKSADDILVPAIQTALQKLDQFSLPALHDLKGKIEKLKMSSESLRSELDKVAQIVDTLKVLVPRDVREKYEHYKSQYDRARNAYEEWNTKYTTLLQELDRVKNRIVEDTFQHFIKSGVPIELDLQEVDGAWQCDWYDIAVRLIEKTYQKQITTEYQNRIHEMLDSVDRLLIF